MVFSALISLLWTPASVRCIFGLSEHTGHKAYCPNSRAGNELSGGIKLTVDPLSKQVSVY